MIEVSPKFKQEVYNQTTGRKTTAVVKFEMLDDSAYLDVSTTTSPSFDLSYSPQTQLTNRVREFTNNYATFEENRIKLDGSFKIPPTKSQAIKNNIEMGFWSEELSKVKPMTWGEAKDKTWGEAKDKTWGEPLLGNGETKFENAQRVECNFSRGHTMIGLSITFDTLANEYPTEFNIKVYREDVEIISKHVENNKYPVYNLVEQFSNCDRIVIEVLDWNKVNSRCKISEIDFGLIYKYTDEELIRLDIRQEISPTSKTIPSDELSFTIDNTSKEFNPLNPEGFYGYLKQGQQITVDIGVEISPDKYEFVPLGKYYLDKWISNEGTITSTFIAKDIYNLLQNREVDEVTVPYQTTLYDMVEKIMIDNNIETYEITNNLKNIPTDGVHRKMTYRTLLQHILVAGKCVTFSDNYGVVHVKEMVTVTNVPFNISISEPVFYGSVEQLTNGEIMPTYDYASFEKDRFRLDGSFTIPRKHPTGLEVGWWSTQMSMETGGDNK